MSGEARGKRADIGGAGASLACTLAVAHTDILQSIQNNRQFEPDGLCTMASCPRLWAVSGLGRLSRPGGPSVGPVGSVGFTGTGTVRYSQRGPSVGPVGSVGFTGTGTVHGFHREGVTWSHRREHGGILTTFGDGFIGAPCEEACGRQGATRLWRGGRPEIREPGAHLCFFGVSCRADLNNTAAFRWSTLFIPSAAATFLRLQPRTQWE